MPQSGRYVEISGHHHWVMEYGEGSPLVLLHGGLGDSERLLAELGDGLAPGRRLIAFDRIGHGRTADADRPFHYADMAAETAGLVAALGLGRVDLCGWSDGGIIGLVMALGHRHLVRRMALIGANFHHDILVADGFNPDAPWLGSVRERYGALSPDGVAHFPEHVRKTFALWQGEPKLTVADLSDIAAPTLVLNGDRDVLIPLAHTMALFEAIPGAELAIVPGAGHSVPSEKPALTSALIAEFLGRGDGA